MPALPLHAQSLGGKSAVGAQPGKPLLMAKKNAVMSGDDNWRLQSCAKFSPDTETPYRGVIWLTEGLPIAALLLHVALGLRSAKIKSRGLI